MTIKADVITTYAFYILLLIISGLGEYFKVLPTGTFLPILTLTVGHFTGATITPAVTQAIKNGAVKE